VDVVALTFRNLDTSVYYNPVSFLQPMRDLIRHIRIRSSARVVVGGSGFSIAPEAILKWLEADLGVSGEGEEALPYILEQLAKGSFPEQPIIKWEPQRRTWNGIPERNTLVDYHPYLQRGGIGGFQTQRGCPEPCPYCVERCQPLVQFPIEEVVEDLRNAKRGGCAELHLCDSEFNHDLDRAVDLLEAMEAADLGIRWTLYMKPRPVSDEMFRLLQATGVQSVTVSVDSFEVTSPNGRYGEEDVIRARQLAARHNIRMAVDLLTGFPEETRASSRRVIQLMHRIRPETVGVSWHFRIFPLTPLSRKVESEPRFRSMIRPRSHASGDYLLPTYYSRLGRKDIQEWIGGDPIFIIEGTAKTSNYQRLAGASP
jgi:radical SAM superfamily enzyme YgiQ (UPF0313 family)